MKRSALCFAPAVLAMCAYLSAQTKDIPKPLVEMRQALGGETTLSAVEAFTAHGTATRAADAGPAIPQRVEIACQLPDKFVRIVTSIGPRRAPNGSVQMEPRSRTFEGFNIDLPIRVMRDAAGRPPVNLSAPASPAEHDRRRHLVARRFQREFSFLALALFGTSFSGYPLDLNYVGRVKRGGREVDAVDAKSPDGFVVQLFIDAATHLPIAVGWWAIPDVVVTTGRASVGGVHEPVEHAMLFSDFRVVHGLKWPHVIEEFAGRRLVRETRLETFAINPKLPPETFSVAR